MAVAGTVWTAALRTSSGAPHDASVEATVPPCGDTVTQWVEDVRMGPRETTSAALSDVDADGVLDALFTNQMDESVTIWWGQKGALPRENVTVATGRAYAPAAVGDIDGDANADLVLALQDDSAFAIVPGRGRRTFGEPSRIFQSPPPVSAALLDVNGDERLDIVYNEFFSNINVRTRAAGSWAPHRKALGLNPATSVAGIVRALPSPRLLLDERGRLLDRTLDGTQQHGHDQLTRWVPGPLGTDQAFAVHSSGQLVRVATGGGLCAIGPYTAPWQPAAMGDIDQDGVLDVIALDSCRECTSNHVFLHGIAATGPGSPP